MPQPHYSLPASAQQPCLSQRSGCRAPPWGCLSVQGGRTQYPPQPHLSTGAPRKDTRCTLKYICAMNQT